MNIRIKRISLKIAKLLCTRLKVERIERQSEGLADLELTLLSNESLTVYRNLIVISTNNEKFTISRLEFMEVSIL